VSEDPLDHYAQPSGAVLPSAEGLPSSVHTEVAMCRIGGIGRLQRPVFRLPRIEVLRMPTKRSYITEDIRCYVCEEYKAPDDCCKPRSRYLCKACDAKNALARYHAKKTAFADAPRSACLCGCGELTEIAVQTSVIHGAISGESRRYKNGHSRRLSPTEYLIEDRGHKTPCWVWQRGKDRDGYGSIPDGLELDHLCRVTSCVNPDHIEPVTSAENTRRGISTKLTADDVREIRSELSKGSLQGALAIRFGIAQTTISAIKRGVTWR
jgi:hypothetical protein